MCRFIIFYAKRRSFTTLKNIFKALISSSKNDPYLFSISNFKSHNHGWGYIIVCFNKEETKIFHGKSLKPIYYDPIANYNYILEPLSTSSTCFGMIHVRLASRKEPINIFSTQPFFLNLENLGYMWFIHNGSVDKNIIAKILGKEELMEIYSDSYFASMLIAKKYMNNRNIVKAIKDCIKYVKTAFNIGIILMNEGKLTIIAMKYLVPERETINKYSNYYKLYYISKDEFKAVVSSTIIDFYLKEEKILSEAFRNGEIRLWEYDISSDKLMETMLENFLTFKQGNSCTKS